MPVACYWLFAVAREKYEIMIVTGTALMVNDAAELNRSQLQRFRTLLSLTNATAVTLLWVYVSKILKDTLQKCNMH